MNLLYPIHLNPPVITEIYNHASAELPDKIASPLDKLGLKK